VVDENTVVVAPGELLGVDAQGGPRHTGSAPAPEPGPTLRVRLDEPTRGVAPGQSVVLYDGTRVVGSGTIRAATRAA
jgi:tRNA-specific 2-thiouridylase